MSHATLAGLLVFLYRQETVAFSEFLGEVILARPVGDALCPPARLGLPFMLPATCSPFLVLFLRPASIPHPFECRVFPTPIFIPLCLAKLASDMVVVLFLSRVLVGMLEVHVSPSTWRMPKWCWSTGRCLTSPWMIRCTMFHRPSVSTERAAFQCTFKPFLSFSLLLAPRMQAFIVGSPFALDQRVQGEILWDICLLLSPDAGRFFFTTHE